MSFPAQQLIQDQQTLIKVQSQDSLKKALDLMSENDFSQLPVVKSDDTYQGMITSDSVLKAISYLGLSIGELKVSHAVEKATPYRQDDDISEILKGLKERNAIAIVNKNSELKGIVTSYDTTEYFRRRAEDIMLAEDIESMLKDMIGAAHCNSNGDVDDELLKAAIQTITPSGKENQGKFREAVCKYLNQASNGNYAPDIKLINQTYTENFETPVPIKDFEKLTLFEYIALLKNVWPRYQPDFHMKWQAIEKLLNDIRNIRNAIAHFREISPQHRTQLKYCAAFIKRHSSSNEAPTTSAISFHSTDRQTTSPTDNKQISLSEIEPTEEDLDPNESRYAPLAQWLESQSESKVSLSFSDIESIINDGLPKSARQHRTWWANDSVSHTQSQQWLEAGWRVSSVNMNLERVQFKAIGERQAAYISFFSSLKSKLQDISNLSFQELSNPQGRNWFGCELSDDQRDSYFIVFSFARSSRFRLELYIDVGHKELNKKVFDTVHQHKTQIESDLGQPLSWERLDSKRGARIALYRQNSTINSCPEELEEIQEWAVEHLPSFYKAIANRFTTNIDQ